MARSAWPSHLSRPAAEHTLTALRYLRADALSVVFLLGTGFLYAATAIYSIGYHAEEQRAVRSRHRRAQRLFARHSRWFYLGMNAFAWSMICAPLVERAGTAVDRVEITTVVSALLVALDNTEGATEAAWKYVLIASSGLGIALLATIFMYYAGTEVLGQSYDLAFDPLIAGAHQLPTPRCGWRSCLRWSDSAPRSVCSRCTPGCPTRTPRPPPRSRRCCRGRCWRVSFYAILRYYQIAHHDTG